MVRVKVPDVVVRRLVNYLRILKDLEASPEDYISSAELAALAGVNAAQVRKDLALFGEFGKQGVGYPVLMLKQELVEILGAGEPVSVSIFGVGELGTALARYLTTRHRFDRDYPFHVKALFDVNPKKIGTTVGGVKVSSVTEVAGIVRAHDIKVGIVTVPPEAAQEVCDIAVRAGIQAFLNFAPVKLKVPEGILVKYQDVASDLQELTFFLRQRTEG